MRRLLLLPLLLAAAVAAHGQNAPVLPTASAKLRAHVEAKNVAGAVTLVAGVDRVLHLEAVGSADLAGPVPMKADSIFWIASMTKPVTAVAVLMLVDEGKLKLDDPVGKHLPELAHLKTADGKEHAVTLRQMLSHTSGMAEAPAETYTRPTLAAVIPEYAARPLQFVPGTQWRYCQSSINSAARVVEVVSGQSFPDFLERRLFGPLGMKDTTFYLSEAQLPRLAKAYARTPEGDLREAPNFILQGKSPTSRDRFPAANGGLFSTAGDYGLFARMLLNRGALNGRRYLKAESAAELGKVQTGDLQTGFTPGSAWGLGCSVVRQPQGVSAMLSPGSFGHGGAYGTQAWIDPGKGRVSVLMVQRANFPNADASEVRRDFQQAAADDLK